nr:ATP-binding protein [Lachnospiraceae bacterium]
MSANNPFCLSFGREPDRYVERAEAYSQITDNLDSISPSNSCYLIMGVRGIGKTVLLSTISNEYRDKDDWVVVSLN